MEAKRGPLRYLAAVGIGVTVALAIETGGMAALAVLANDCTALGGLFGLYFAIAPALIGGVFMGKRSLTASSDFRIVLPTLALLACAACVGITAYAGANAPPPTGTDCAM
jgi:hypothetical protein